MVTYFFDTYALVELIKRNPKFMPYGEYPLTTTMLNKIELYWCALNFNGEELGRISLNSISDVQEISDEVIGSAMRFRKNTRRKTSRMLMQSVMRSQESTTCFLRASSSGTIRY